MTFSNGTKAPLPHPDDDFEEFMEEWRYHNGEILFECGNALDPDFFTNTAQVDTEIGLVVGLLRTIKSYLCSNSVVTVWYRRSKKQRLLGTKEVF
jgi:hypothetical protein